MVSNNGGQLYIESKSCDITSAPFRCKANVAKPSVVNNAGQVPHNLCQGIVFNANLILCLSVSQEVLPLPFVSDGFSRSQNPQLLEANSLLGFSFFTLLHEQKSLNIISIDFINLI
jgi:hypothetical protein